MLRSTASPCPMARLVLLATLGLLASACSGSTNGAISAKDGGAGGVGEGATGAAGGDANANVGDDTGSSAGLAPVVLGAAGNYVILAKSAIATVPTSAVTGDLGLSPAAASYITGFSLTRAGTKWTSSQVTGSVFAADNDPPTPIDLTTAVGSMETAYTDAAGRPTPRFLDLGGGAIGGLTLAPGLYKWTSAVNAASDLTIAGGSNDVWIFQITGDLTMGASTRMTLSGGAMARNIVWQVAGVADFASASHVEGIVLSQTAIKLGTGASINGRLFAQTSVDIAGATVTAPQ